MHVNISIDKTVKKSGRKRTIHRNITKIPFPEFPTLGEVRKFLDKNELSDWSITGWATHIEDTKSNLFDKLGRMLPHVRKEIKESNAWIGYDRLFVHCCREYGKLRRNGIYAPSNIQDIKDALYYISSKLVNNPKSSFYIHGR